MNDTSTPILIDCQAFAAALRAFTIAEPGVLRHVARVDSYPGEHPDDPDAYAELPSTPAHSRAALMEFLVAYLENASR